MAAIVEEVTNSWLEFYGLKLKRFAIKGGDVTLMGRRDRGDMPHQIWCIKVSREHKIAEVSVDKVNLFHISGAKVSFGALEKMAISALHRLLKECYRKSAKGRRERAQAK